MAIQNRRGVYNDFDPSKMVEGEFAVVKQGDPNTSDGTSVYISTATGTAKRIALYQDIQQEVQEAVGNLKNAVYQYPDVIATVIGTVPIMFEYGFYHLTTDTVATNKIESETYATAIYKVSPGDVVTINAAGGGANVRKFAYLDANYIVVQGSNANSVGRSVVTIPDNISYIVINNDLTLMGSGFYAYIGANIDTETRELKNAIGNLPYIGNYPEYNGTIAASTNTWVIRTDRKYKIIEVNPYDQYKISNTQSGTNAFVAFLSSYTTPVNGGSPSFSTEKNGTVSIGEIPLEGVIPSDCHYLYVYVFNGSADMTPKELVINGYDYTKSLYAQFSNPEVKKEETNDAVGVIVDVAETYFNAGYSSDNALVYRSNHGLFSDPFENGVNAMVCSQFSQACIAGISYDNSRYVNGLNGYNKPCWWGFVSDGTGVYSNVKQNKEPGSTDDSSDYGEAIPNEWYEYGKDYMSAEGQYNYFKDKGVAHDFDPDHNGILPGDILFYLASTWDTTVKDTEDDYVSHVVICLRPYETSYVFMHSNSGWIRYVDGNEVGVCVQKWNYSTTPPTYYVHLKDIPIGYAKTSSIIVGDYEINKSGTYSNIARVNQFSYSNSPLEKGFYTVNVLGSGKSDHYVRVFYSNGTEVNYYSEDKAGQSSIVFYAEMPITKIDLYANNGTEYDVYKMKLYRGYHSYE